MLNSNKTLKRFEIAPINTKEIKFNFYAPLEKISNKDKNKKEFLVYQNNNDNNEISIVTKNERLTQVHKDILDIILTFGKKYNENEDYGKIIYLNEIQKRLGHKYQKNNEWLKQKIEELSNVKIKITQKNEDKNFVMTFGIIRATMIDEKTKMYKILFEELYLNFFELFVSINFSKSLLQDILLLKHAVTKASVRYLFTFKEQQINVDKLLDKIGITGSKRNIEIHRKKLIEELEETGHKFGIEIIKGRFLKDYLIRYKKPSEVKFYYPVKTATQ